jgi:hypothetical protein
VSGSAAALREAFDEVVQVTPKGVEAPAPAEAERLLVEAARQWAAAPRRATP